MTRVFPGETLSVPGYALPIATLVDEGGDVVLWVKMSLGPNGASLHARGLWSSFHATVTLPEGETTQATCDKALTWLAQSFGHQLVLLHD